MFVCGCGVSCSVVQQVYLLFIGGLFVFVLKCTGAVQEMVNCSQVLNSLLLQGCTLLCNATDLYYPNSMISK